MKSIDFEESCLGFGGLHEVMAILSRFKILFLDRPEG